MYQSAADEVATVAIQNVLVVGTGSAPVVGPNSDGRPLLRKVNTVDNAMTDDHH